VRIQPEGVRTLMPMPLSSQTNSTGSGHVLVGGPVAAVLNAPVGGGVVGAGVAEGADDDAVVRPRRGQAGAARSIAKATPTALRQVAGDRAGLRRMASDEAAEDLVAAARDGLVGGGADAAHHVEARRGARHLPGAGAEEAAGAVVEEGRVGRAQRPGDGGVALVARAADRVVALALRAQPARRVIELAAADLALEESRGSRATFGDDMGARLCRAPGRSATSGASRTERESAGAPRAPNGTQELS
jgi:hypothetical protein